MASLDRRGELPERQRHRLLGFSRHGETPREHITELIPDGTNYFALGSADSEDFADNWQVLKMVLEDAYHKLTRQEILEQGPADSVRKSTLPPFIAPQPRRPVCGPGRGQRAQPGHLRGRLYRGINTRPLARYAPRLLDCRRLGSRYNPA